MLEQKTILLIFSLSPFPNISLKGFELSWGFPHYEYILIHITGFQVLYGSDFLLAYGYSFCFLVFWTYSVQIGFIFSAISCLIVTGGDIFTGGVLFLSLPWMSKGGESFQSLSSCQRGSLLASFVTQSECCHMPNFECFTHMKSHGSMRIMSQL